MILENVAERLGPLLRRILKTLLPNPLSSWLNYTQQRPNKLSSTSCLQGLRGLAAVIVFHCHLLRSFSNFVDYGYGVDRKSELGLENRWFHQLPFLRLAYSGGAMVEIFFLVSGYTQSLKALSLMQGRKRTSNHKLLVLTLFRRFFRLLIPTFVAGVLVAAAVWIGLYEWGSKYRRTWFDGNPIALDRESSFFKELWALWQSFMGLVNLWDWKIYYPVFNPHMWTIAVELRCSVVLQLLLYAMALIHHTTRIPVLLGLLLACNYLERWDLVCFLNGLLLAYINQIRGTHSKSDCEKSGSLVGPFHPPPVVATTKSLVKRVIYAIAYILGLYLLSFPKIDGALAPGYRTIGSFSPGNWDPHRFWNMWGAFLTVLALTNDRFLARFYENHVLQYLGKISYAMYLVHGPVLHIVAYVLVPMMWLVTGRKGILIQVVSFEIATFVFVVPAVFLAADLFHRTVDTRVGTCVIASRTVYLGSFDRKHSFKHWSSSNARVLSWPRTQ